MMFSWSKYVRAVAITEEIAPRYRSLRIVQLAQAIVESARGNSKLFQKAGNPYGMKWRDRITKYDRTNSLNLPNFLTSNRERD